MDGGTQDARQVESDPESCLEPLSTREVVERYERMVCAMTSWSGEKQRLRYLVYRYQPHTGFELVKRIALNTGNDGRAPHVRELLIDNHLYLASAVQVTVLSTADFGEAATVTLKN